MRSTRAWRSRAALSCWLTLLAFVGALLLGTTRTASAQAYVWNGGTDNDWNTATNWAGGVTPPTGARIHITHRVTIPAHATKTISLTPADFHALRIHHPQIWWPYQMGSHPLYGLRMAVSEAGLREGAAYWWSRRGNLNLPVEASAAEAADKR